MRLPMKVKVEISVSSDSKTTYEFNSLKDASELLKKEVREFNRAKRIDAEFWREA